METVVVVEGNDEEKYEDSGVEKGSTSLSSLKEVADPVVYKLVRVQFDLYTYVFTYLKDVFNAFSILFLRRHQNVALGLFMM